MQNETETIASLKRRIGELEARLRQLPVDQLPEPIAADARRRIAAGLPHEDAVAAALAQAEHDQKVANEK